MAEQAEQAEQTVAAFMFENGEASRRSTDPLALGGEPLPVRPGVLCSSCNARKGLSQRRR